MRAIRLEIGLLAMLCVSQYFEVAPLNLLITGGVLLLMLLQKRVQDCALALFVALPMFNLLNLRVGTISLYYLLVFAFWLRYFQHCRWRIRKGKLLTLLALLLIRLTSGSVVDTLTWFTLLSVLVLTYREDFFDQNIESIVFWMSVAFVISSAFGYAMLEGGRSIYTRSYVWSAAGNTIRFAGVIGDAVFYSQFCALLTAANLALACYRRAYFRKGVLLSAVIAAFCLVSYSKTGLFLILCAAIAALFWQIWAKSRSRRTMLRAMLIALGGVAAVIALTGGILAHPDGELVRNYALRLTKGDLLTGRSEVWAHYISLLKGSWRTLICAMPEDVFTALRPMANGSMIAHTHNIYIETVCAFGLPAALAMLLWVLHAMLRSILRRDGILMLMPICVILASGFALHGHFEFHYYTLVAVAISFLSGRGRERQ